MQRKSSAIVPVPPGVAHDQVHQAHQLRNEKDEGEDGQPQNRVGGYFAAYVSIEKAHKSAVAF